MTDSVVPLSGKNAVVTGGSGGLGASIARRLARAGAAVCIADVRREDGEKVCAALRVEGHEAHFMELDVRDADAAAALFESLESEAWDGSTTAWLGWPGGGRSGVTDVRRFPP